MRTLIKSVFIRMIALLLATSVAIAQDRSALRQEELDQVLAPIALYPDSLLSQILMAATYPLEVVQAARWSRSHPELRGQDAVKAVEQMEWDPSVKSLVAFPQVLHRMDENLDWTQRLGEAFLAYEPQVMDTVQGLRQRAAEAGNLRSGDQMRVTRQGDDYTIEPANPQVVYVPYYDPAVVYGPWWWPAYPPAYWGPPPGYYFTPAFGPGFFWGSGIVISTGFFFGHFNWHHRHVTVVHKHVLVTRHAKVHPHHTNITSPSSRVAWRHDPEHRRGVPFRNAALREQFSGPRRAEAGARQETQRQGAAPAVRQSERPHPADFRERRADGRSGAVAVQDGREKAFNRIAPQSNDRRPDSRRDATRIEPRSGVPQPTAMAPAARIDARAAGAVSGGNGRQASAPERARRPESRGVSDLPHVSRQVTAIRDSAPAPRLSASSGGPAPRMGNGNHRGDGGARPHGGGHRNQSMATAIR